MFIEPPADWRSSGVMSPGTRRHRAWRESVQAYISLGDRDVEPVFVGRLSHFKLLRSCIQRSGANGAAMVVPGAPGAGKTAFLKRVEARSGELGFLPVPVKSGSFHLPGKVLSNIAEALGAAKARRVALASRSKRKGAKGGAGLLAIDYARTETTASLVARAGEGVEFPWDELRELLSAGGERRPVGLLVDEAQHIWPTPGNPKGRNDVLTSLYTGDDFGALPVFNVFAGLPETFAHLRKLGLSRPTNITVGSSLAPMGRISKEEAREYVWSILKHLGTFGDEGDAVRFVAMTVEDSQEWPHHLRNGMEALAQIMLSTDSADMTVLMSCWPEIAARAKLMRDLYYAGSLAAAEKHTSFAGEVARAILETLNTGAADAKSLKRAASTALAAARVGDPVLAEMESGSAIKVFEALQHGGVIQQSPRFPRRWACPIPSLKTWICDNCSLPPKWNLGMACDS